MNFDKDDEWCSQPSNFSLNVVAVGYGAFRRAVEIAFINNAQGASFYKSDKGKITLCWLKSENTTKLPYLLTMADAPQFVWNWLQKVPKDEYHDYCDIDGSCLPEAFNVVVDPCAHGEICIVKAVYAEYHK